MESLQKKDNLRNIAIWWLQTQWKGKLLQCIGKETELDILQVKDGKPQPE